MRGGDAIHANVMPTAPEKRGNREVDTLKARKVVHMLGCSGSSEYACFIAFIANSL
jgi:hypothetical protein